MPRVRLMLTCLCDAFYGEVGIATVKVLERVGCEVVFEEKQTCCGQPPFNSGDWPSARKIASSCRRLLLEGEEVVVTPSSSCAAMIRHGHPLLFGHPDLSHAEDAEGRRESTSYLDSTQTGTAEDPLRTSAASACNSVFELSEYLVRHMGICKWPAVKPYPHMIAIHRACHGRTLGLSNEQEQLLAGIPGIAIMPFDHGEQCCGFGGAFSITHGKLSSEIGLEKLARIAESGAEEIVSGDMGCLMHLKGLIAKNNIPLRARHFAEILAEVAE